MHELALAGELVALVEEHAQGQPVVAVTVEVGRLAAVVADSLRFGFEVCAAETALAGAELRLVEVDGRGRCRDCGQEAVLTHPLAGCSCGSLSVEWLSGFDVKLKEIEVEQHV